MTEKVVYQLGSEVLQHSALHDFPWPEIDPQTISQKTLPWSEQHSRLLDMAVENIKFSMDRFVGETKSLSPHERALHLLSSGAFNFNGVEKVRGERFWLERLVKAVAAEEPIAIPYPLICKINHPAKRLTLVGCTAGERAVVRFFRNLGCAMKTIYPPGLKVHVLSDATLYNSALQVPPPSAYAYMEEFRRLIAEKRRTDLSRCTTTRLCSHLITASLKRFTTDTMASYRRRRRSREFWDRCLPVYGQTSTRDGSA